MTSSDEQKHHDTSLHQSLLDATEHEEDDSQLKAWPQARMHRASSGPPQPQATPSGRGSCCRLLDYYWAILMHIIASDSIQVPPSLLKLQERVKEGYSPSNPDHVEKLRRLWGNSYPSIPFPLETTSNSIKSSQWKEMGWQGEDPGTDIRGAGVLGLDCLVHFSTAHPSSFQRLLNKTEGARAEWEYPFCVGGLNVAFMLSEVVGIKLPFGSSSSSQTAVSPLNSAAGRGFIGLLQASDNEQLLFEEVFVATFEELDRCWLRMRCSYMEFGAVLKSVRGKVTLALSQNPQSIEELRDQLAIE